MRDVVMLQGYKAGLPGKAEGPASYPPPTSPAGRGSRAVLPLSPGGHFNRWLEGVTTDAVGDPAGLPPVCNTT